jgi:hypothetical protein
MFRHLLALVGLLLALSPVPARGADAWARLRLGMTADETEALLGTPLIRTSGHGFELWTYDNGAEVLLYGSLIGWTNSGSTSVATRSFDIWRARRTESFSPTFLEVLPRNAAGSTQKVRAPRVVVPRDDVWLPVYVRRRN